MDFLGKFLIHYAEHLDVQKGAKLDAAAVAKAAADAAAAPKPSARADGGFHASVSGEAKVRSFIEKAGAGSEPISAATVQ